MRFPALAALAVLAATPVFAAEKVWTDAPVPGFGNTNNVTPAGRAGQSNGPDNSSPFSGVPSGSAAANTGSTGPTTARDLTDAQAPSVSR